MASINDIVSKSAIASVLDAQKAIDELDQANIAAIKSSDKLNEQFKEISESSDEAAKKTGAYSKIINESVETNKKLSGSTAEYNKIQAKLIKTQDQLSVSQTRKNKALVEARLRLQDANKAIKDKLKSNQAEEGSLVRMRQKLKQLTDAYDSSGKRTKAAATEIKNLSKEIGVAEEATNRHQRGVGGYREQLGDLKTSVMSGTSSFASMKSGIIGVGKAAMAFLLSPVGLVIGLIGGLVLGGKALIDNARGFEKASSSLSAITGAVGDDLDYMKEKAIEFSKSSLSSAESILGAFEIVGSAMPALLSNGALLTDVTKDAITLSEATGGKLAVEDAAKAAAGAMNQFNIPLTESTRAVNVLAAGSLAGSADILSLSESFKNVGSVASGAGLTLEQTIGLLEVLAEKSLFGSEAGTALRGSILKMQAAGLGYTSGVFNMKDALEEANVKLEEQGTQLEKDAFAQKLFGAENITAGKILLNNVDNYERLTAAVTGTNTAYDQQKIQMDNLDGSYAKLSNLWKAFMLGFEDGNGIIASAWKGIVDLTAAFIDGMIQWQKAFSKMVDLFRSKEAKAAKERQRELKEQAKAEEAAAMAKEQQAKAEEELAKAAIEINKQAAEESKKTEKEKTEALKEGIKESNRLLKEKQAADKVNADYDKALAKEISEFILEDEKEMFSDLGDEGDKAVDEFIKNEEAKADQFIKNKQIEYEQNLLILQANSANDEEYAQKKFELDKEIVQNGIDALNLQLQNAELTGVARIEIENQIADQQLSLNQMLADDDKKKAEEKEQRLNDIKDKSIDIANQLFDFRINKIQGEQTELEAQKEAGQLTEQEYAKKKAELDIKASKAERQKALFNIALSTGEAVAGAIAASPATFGLPFSAFAVVTGALQAAAVLSQPLPVVPAFWKGGNVSTDSFTIAERGREILEKPSGEMMLFNSPALVSDSSFKGSHIYSNATSERMMSNGGHSGFGSLNRTDGKDIQILSDIRSELRKSKRPIYDKDNRPIGYEQNGSTTKYLNRYRF